MKSTQSVRNEVRSAPRTGRPDPFEPTQDLRAVSTHSVDKAAAILWVRMQMVRNGISYEDLVRAGCFDGGAARRVVRYRSADGRTWDGQGERPDWLQRAVNAGQNIDHFRVG